MGYLVYALPSALGQQQQASHAGLQESDCPKSMLLRALVCELVGVQPIPLPVAAKGYSLSEWAL